MLNPAGEKKQGINEWLYEQSKGVVLTGPFTGMKVLRQESWIDGNLGCKLLGTYEEELHELVEREVVRLADCPSPVIVNIGCAEGYYAIGFARRLPQAAVYAIDTDDEALKIASDAAHANEVKIVIGAPLDQIFTAPDLVVCDCEGGEIEYLDLKKFPALKAATILVECHEFSHQHTTDILVQRFRGTHTIAMIIEGARDPNRFEFLRHCHSLDRWAAVSEGRPMMMHWLFMQPRSAP